MRFSYDLQSTGAQSTGRGVARVMKLGGLTDRAISYPRRRKHQLRTALTGTDTARISSANPHTTARCLNRKCINMKYITAKIFENIKYFNGRRSYQDQYTLLMCFFHPLHLYRWIFTEARQVLSALLMGTTAAPHLVIEPTAPGAAHPMA